MGRAWELAFAASVVLLGCGGGAEHAGSGSNGAGNGGSAELGTAGASTTNGGAPTAIGGSGAVGGSPNMSGTGGAASSAAPIPIANLCPIFTADLCLYLMQCNGARYKDTAQCEQELDCYGLPQLLNANANGVIDYNPSAVGACHARFIASPCDFGFFLSTPDIYDVLAFCPGTVTPKQVAGGACSSSGECATGLYCNKGADFTCPGTCDTPAVAGAACVGSVQCGADLECKDQQCVPTQKAGDSCTDFCSASVDCPSGQVCPGDIWCDTNAMKCEPGRMVGEACGLMTTGTSSYQADCAVNLWCNGVAFGPGTCQAPGAEGAPCTTAFSACQSGLHCVGYDSTQSNSTLGKCSGPSAAGTACLVANDCQSGLMCAEETCTAPLAAGAACDNDDNCAAGLVCQNNQCVKALYPGDPCSPASPCAFSRCVDGTCRDYAKVGEVCAANTDCATNQCAAGKCYDGSVCAIASVSAL
jgi:hypothetical protein